MLVPEISLTPQITSILVSRFKSDIAILHSGLSVSEKYNMWKKIYDGDIKITVGARSAVFAPIDNLGIIIIDEEHESSYVQDNNPKYDAKEIASLRALKHNCPLILGSATPSVVDYHKALTGEYELITLNKRANNKPLPSVEVVSLVDELKRGNTSVFSNRLKSEILQNYKKGEQSIIFLNRRGYSTFVMCRSCGEVIKCEHCDISLTYHQNSNTLKCHHCGYTINNVVGCPNCGSSKIRYVGSGTQKIEDDLHNFIPEAKVIRLDHDTTRGKDDYEKAYREFKDKKADILVGTQMITKGLDFENVTLVGIINADLALNYPTYDAYEEAFNVLEQVSGRAGRDRLAGKVIIQTYNPTNPVIKCVKNHDYEGFFNYEINKRKLAMMPPYSSLYEIMVSSENKVEAIKASKVIVNTLKKDNKNSYIYGPLEASIFKKNDQYRYIIQIQAMDDKIIENIKNIYPTYQSSKDITLSITRK
jgi:primosomal protein N' (replication factor Y)